MKTKNEWIRLLEPRGEYGDDGGADLGANDIWDDGDGGGFEDPVDDFEEPEYQAPQEQQVPLSAIEGIVRGLQPQQQQPQQPQLTQEQIDAQLKVFRPDAAFAQKLFGGDASPDQVEALNALVKNIAEHMTTVMGYANQYTRDTLEQRYAPALEAVREQKAQMFTGVMTQRFPALKGKENAIRHVVQQLNQQGYAPQSEQECLQTVARHVEHVLKMADPNFSLQRKQGQPNHAPQMAGLTGGSGGGAAGAANKGGRSKKPGWLSIWD